MKVKRIKVTEVEIDGLGEKIKQARLSLPRNGKTIDQLCRDAGISRTYWYDIENERPKGGLSEELFRKIEAAIGVDFGVTFDD